MGTVRLARGVLDQSRRSTATWASRYGVRVNGLISVPSYLTPLASKNRSRIDMPITTHGIVAVTATDNYAVTT